MSPRHLKYNQEAGVYTYDGPWEPPTDEEWEQYLATAPDDETRAEWAKLKESQ